MLTRRQWMQIAGAAGLVAGLGGRRALASSGSLDVGLQLWTVKDALAADFEGTLRALAAMGLHEVELAELGGRPATRTRDGLKAAGLACRNAHVRFWDFEANFGQQVENAQTIGVDTLVIPVPWMPPEMVAQAMQGRFAETVSQGMTLDLWKKTAEKLNQTGEKLKTAGLALAYHNHNVDFRLFGHQRGYDILVENTDPALVKLELDIGWVVSAGLDPIPYLRRWPSRYVALHVKDVKAGYTPNFAIQTSPIEVGYGVIDWVAVLQAAADAGVRRYYLEQEEPFIRPPLESVRISLEKLREITPKIRMSAE